MYKYGLIHHLINIYTIKNNICTKANCIIPTNQNHANIQHDMEEFVPQILNKSETRCFFININEFEKGSLKNSYSSKRIVKSSANLKYKYRVHEDILIDPIYLCPYLPCRCLDREILRDS